MSIKYEILVVDMTKRAFITPRTDMAANMLVLVLSGGLATGK
jgi:hypothetical protein